MKRILNISLILAVFQCNLYSQLVINQVQVGGSVSALDEFVELLNTTSLPVSLAGYRLRFYTSSGVNSSNCDFPLDFPSSVPANGFFLIASTWYDVQGISYDHIWTGGYTAAAGQIGLFNGSGQLVDGLAYGPVGNNIVGEGNPAAAPPADQSLIRSPDGTDAGDNSADFEVSISPVPRNASSDPLPITLVSFAVTRLDQSHIQLTWRTLSEINNYGFEVQKSPEAQQGYLTIANSFVPGHCTTNEPQQYSYTDPTPFTRSWYYRLKQIDLDGSFHYSDPVHANMTTVINDKDIPTIFSMSQNYPNPFNPSTTITFTVVNRHLTTLIVYDLQGREVATLVNEVREPGTYTVHFDGSNLSSGVYVYRLRAGGFTRTKTAVLLR